MSNTTLANRSFVWMRRSLSAGVFVGAVTFPVWGGMLSAAVDHHMEQDAQADTMEEAKQQAQEGMMAQMSPEEQEMMQKMMEAAEPGDMHQMMQDHFAGSWTVKSDYEMNGQTMTSEGASRAMMEFGGRHLVEQYEGDMMGQPFRGGSITSYDNTAKQFQSVWIDEMSTGMYYATGQYDEASQTLTMEGQGADPTTGQMAKFKYEIKVTSPDEHVMKMWQEMGGEMTEIMTMTYTRDEGGMDDMEDEMDEMGDDMEDAMDDAMDDAADAMDG